MSTLQARHLSASLRPSEFANTVRHCSTTLSRGPTHGIRTRVQRTGSEQPCVIAASNARSISNGYLVQQRQPAGPAGNPTTQLPTPLTSDGRSALSSASERLILYDFPFAYNPAKARIMLVEKRLPFTTNTINVIASQGVSPDFMQVNPEATLPCLRDGSKLLTQSKEIVMYLDERDGMPLGGKQVDRQEVDEWVEMLAQWDGNIFVEANDPTVASILGFFGEYKKAAIRFYRERNPALRSVYDQKLATISKTQAKNSKPESAEANRAELRAILKKAESSLAKRNFLAGSEYSVADALLSVILWRLNSVNQIDKYVMPRTFVSRYWGMIQARPSYARAFGPSTDPLNILTLAVPAVSAALLQKAFGIIL